MITELEIHCPSMLNTWLIPQSRHCPITRQFPIVPSQEDQIQKRIAFQCLVTRNSQLLKIRSSAQAVTTQVQHSTPSWRPSRHLIFNVFRCFLRTGAVTAFVPRSAVMSSPSRFSMRISPEPTPSCNQSTRQWRCRIRPAPRLAMIPLVELAVHTKNTLRNVFAKVQLYAFGTQQN